MLARQAAQAIPEIIKKAPPIALEGVARTLTLLPALLLAPVNGSADPAKDRDWQLYHRNHPQPAIPLPPKPDEVRLAELEHALAAQTLTAPEEAELIILLAKVKGIHVQKVTELEIVIPKEHKIERILLNAPDKPGNAPKFKSDGTSVEIHHIGQQREGPFLEMHKEDHRGKGNDKVNHPNKHLPSQVDRREFDRAKKKYWKKEFPDGK